MRSGRAVDMDRGVATFFPCPLRISYVDGAFSRSFEGHHAASLLRTVQTALPLRGFGHVQSPRSGKLFSGDHADYAPSI